MTVKVFFIFSLALRLSCAHTAGSLRPIVATEGHGLYWKHESFHKSEFCLASDCVFFSSSPASFLKLVLVPVALITVLHEGVLGELLGGWCQHVWLLVLNRWRVGSGPSYACKIPSTLRYKSGIWCCSIKHNNKDVSFSSTR